MERARNECAVCGGEIYISGTGWYREIRGWEQVRSSGGANKITLRRTTGRMAHAGCIGTDPKQTGLFPS